ncbi:MAG: TIGR03435 family protein [Acidobacteria bacterium]|nr:MAG: TIGR03435 family protein [Acidobacteriota bacterium]
MELTGMAHRITLMSFTRILAGIVCTGVATWLHAPRFLLVQAPATPNDRPKFEVASVRPNTADDGRVMLGIQPGGRFNAVNVPLWDLIRQAYGVQRSQIVDGPDWIETARYDTSRRPKAATSRAWRQASRPVP